jgi:amino acid transporter
LLGINVIGFRFGKWVSHFGAALMMVLTLTFFVVLFWHPGATAAHPHVSPQSAVCVWVAGLVDSDAEFVYQGGVSMRMSGLEQVAVFAGETKNAARTIVLSAWIAAPAMVVIYVLMTRSMLTYVPYTDRSIWRGRFRRCWRLRLGAGAGSGWGG